ncbi:MAG: ATP-binding cassette domain-containing protein [Elusimicrobiales bacterium]
MPLEINGLSFRHCGARDFALRGVDLRIPAGECAFVRGENGSGKTTLVAAVSGISPAFGGGEISGLLDICGARPASVLQNIDAQMLHETAGGEMEFYARYGAPGPVSVNEAARAMGVEKLLERQTHTLSSGEMQRAAISCALFCSDGKLLVLDEPASCLDAAGQRLLAERICALKSGGASVLVTGHGAGALADCADAVYELSGGALRRAGFAPQEEAAAPAARPGGVLLRAENVCAESEAHEIMLAPSRLEMREGEVAGITGANGSGKSSLAKLLAGWIAPKAGYIEFEGKRADCSCLRRQSRLLGQNPYHGLLCATAAENLEQARRRALRPGFDAARAVEILEAGPLLPRDVNRLSFGQAQRVALLCALAYNPRVLILDEFTACLDARGIAQSARLLREYAAAGGAAAVVSHLESHLAPLCGRILAMKDIYAPG